MRLLTTCLLVSLALPVSAQIYQYTDEKGNKVFTDMPSESKNAEPVKLPEFNQVTPPAEYTQPVTNSPRERHSIQNDSSSKIYSQLKLNLSPEQTIRANGGSLSVSVQISPALTSGHTLQLVIDGQAVGTPSSSTQLTANNVDRGEHQLAVQVLNAGNVLQTSEPVTIVVQRTHI